MLKLTIDDLKAQNLILLECLSGSKAYGLDTPTSDTDIKGVFYLPKSHYYGLHKDYIAQVSNESNDIVYYELGRFIELLLQNNPNMMELLATPCDKILYKHPIMDTFKPEWFISKVCEQTFVGFASAQIKKARGFNKKIVNPMAKDKKSILAFCYVLVDNKAVELTKWLMDNHINQSQIGLSAMPHTTQLYALFVDDSENGTMNFNGIIKKDNATQVLLSPIPKGIKPIAYLSFNQMGFSKYCKDYGDYWAWVENRNEVRYQTTEKHNKGYDSKNMMHTIRLLQIAQDIATTGKVIVKRANRDELLAIKAGEFDYDDLVEWADRLSNEIIEQFKNSNLPDMPDEVAILNNLIQVREFLYSTH
ncbi:MAG: nucleotidyltransferase domain-containing protein [Moraxella sp.]|nr:nucleotidyltransferase domain-containing protein [Moraxella sp.]